MDRGLGSARRPCSRSSRCCISDAGRPDADADAGADLVVSLASLEERGELTEVFQRAFPPFERVAFSTKGHVLIARNGTRVVGGAVLRAPEIADRTIGVVDWIFADPDEPVPGVGTALRDAADRWFDEVGCGEHVARIEPVNTASQELHRRAGYAPLSLRGQLRRWGWRTPRIWAATHSGIDPGLRPWVRPPAPERPRARWAGTVALNVALLAIVTWRAPRDLGLDPAGLAWLIAIAVLLLGARETTIAVVARSRGLHLRHVPWTSGAGLSLALAAAFGVWWPLPGSRVPDDGPWRYERTLSQLATAYFAGGVVVATLAWAAVLTPETAAPLPWADLQRAAVMLALFDLVVPTAPLYGTTARIVVDRSRVAWAVLAVAGAGALVYGTWLS